MLVDQQFAIRQICIILGDVSVVICNVRRAAEVVTVIEEGLFLCSVSRDKTITSLRVIGVARVIPGDGGI